jgi:hypothetical protein
VVVLPLPRYVLAACCASPAHIINREAADYQALLSSMTHTCRNIIKDAQEGINTEYLFYNPVSTFSNGPLNEMKASDGPVIGAYT